MRRHVSAFDAAVAAGVGRVVCLCFLAASPEPTITRGHFSTKEHIRATGLRHTFPRDNTYTDFLVTLA